MDFLQLIEVDLIDDEGYRRAAYQDHLGYLTIGIGRLIDNRKGGGITLDEARYLLRNDIARVAHELKTAFNWYDNAPIGVKRALMNMTFQMGIGGVKGFKNTMRLLEHGNYVGAAAEAMNSTWARQTPKRAARVCAWIRNAGGAHV